MATPVITDEPKLKDRHKTPILPIKDFEDILLQLRADPNCRSCYGRGYVSFSSNVQGGKTMNLCGCSSFGETELLRVLSAQALVSQQVGSMNNAVVECLLRIEAKQKDDEENTKRINEYLMRSLGYLTETEEHRWNRRFVAVFRRISGRFRGAGTAASNKRETV